MKEITHPTPMEISDNLKKIFEILFLLFDWMTNEEVKMTIYFFANGWFDNAFSKLPSNKLYCFITSENTEQKEKILKELCKDAIHYFIKKEFPSEKVDFYLYLNNDKKSYQKYLKNSSLIMVELKKKNSI